MVDPHRFSANGTRIDLRYWNGKTQGLPLREEVQFIFMMRNMYSIL